jgi:hypothetical protein
MYTNTVFNAAFRAVPGLTTPISCPSSTTTRLVSVSQGPSSGVYAVARKPLQYWHTEHTLSIKFFTLAQNYLFLFITIKLSNFVVKLFIYPITILYSCTNYLFLFINNENKWFCC